MSENLLCILPTSPEFRPPRREAAAALAAVRLMAPHAHEIRIRDESDVQFVDAGSNFEAIGCPVCKSDVSTDWWSERMSEAGAAHFTALQVTIPCCSSLVSLNELTYRWPQGFARWWIEVRQPERRDLSDSEVSELAGALGQAVRIVWAHY